MNEERSLVDPYRIGKHKSYLMLLFERRPAFSIAIDAMEEKD